MDLRAPAEHRRSPRPSCWHWPMTPRRTWCAPALPPRGLLALLGAWVATLLSLRHVAPLGLLIALASLLLPLALWCLLHYRRRPRPRRLVENDGAYAGYFLFGLLALAGLQFWEALGPIAITAKWLSVFAVFWFCQQRMRRALALARQKDAHEHAH